MPAYTVDIPAELAHPALIHGRFALYQAQKEASRLRRNRRRMRTVAAERVAELADRLTNMRPADWLTYEQKTWGGTASQLLPPHLRVDADYDLRAAAAEFLAWVQAGAPEVVIDARPKAMRS